MNDSQQAMFRGMKNIVSDISQKVDHFHTQHRLQSPSRDRQLRLMDLRQEADDLVNIMTDQFTNLTPEFLANADRHFDDMRDRLVALQTRLNAFTRQYSRV
jgi:hypothetical protein